MYTYSRQIEISTALKDYVGSILYTYDKPTNHITPNFVITSILPEILLIVNGGFKKIIWDKIKYQ